MGKRRDTRHISFGFNIAIFSSTYMLIVLYFEGLLPVMNRIVCSLTLWSFIYSIHTIC